MPDHIHRNHTDIPHITTNAGAPGPTDIPSKVGDIFIDTTNKNIYMATDTTSDGDWVLLNSA